MYAPPILDFTQQKGRAIVRGDSIDISITFKVNGAAEDLTDFTAKCQARKQVEDAEPVFEFKTADGSIPPLTSSGEIHLTMTAANSQQLPTGKFLYDLQITSPAGVVTTIARGAIEVIGDISR